MSALFDTPLPITMATSILNRSPELFTTPLPVVFIGDQPGQGSHTNLIEDPAEPGMYILHTS